MPTSNDVVIALLQTLQESVDGQHERTNKRLEDGFRDLNAKFEAHEKDDRATARVVDRIVIEREREASDALKRSTLAGILGAAGLSAGLEVFKAWWVK